jgi:hypothetical protein
VVPALIRGLVRVLRPKLPALDRITAGAMVNIPGIAIVMATGQFVNESVTTSR